jgi:hypothetical protein
MSQSHDQQGTLLRYMRLDDGILKRSQMVVEIDRDAV